MNKRKNVNTIICLLLVLIFAFTGCKNQKNIENTEKNKNFNFEDINISEVVEPNLVKFHNDSIYVQGVDKNSVNNFFNLKMMRLTDYTFWDFNIQISEEKMVRNVVNNDGDLAYAEHFNLSNEDDFSETFLSSINKNGEIINTIARDADSRINSMLINNLNQLVLVTQNRKKNILLKKYNDKLELISAEVNINEKLGINEIIDFIISQNSDVTYNIAVNENNKWVFYKLSENFEIIFKYDTEKMNYDKFKNFTSANGNLLIQTLNGDINTVDEYSLEDGKLLNMYDFTDTIHDFYNGYDKNDIIYLKDNGLYGFDFENEQEKVIYENEEFVQSILGGLSFGENLCFYLSKKNEVQNGVFVFDVDGKLQKSNDIGDMSIQYTDMLLSSKGQLAVLYLDQSNKYGVKLYDENLKLIKEKIINIEGYLQFISLDDESNLYFIDREKPNYITQFNIENEKVKNSKTKVDEAIVSANFTNEFEGYVFSNNINEPKLKVLDKKTLDIKSEASIEKGRVFNNIKTGYEKHDLYYYDQNNIYGYNIKDNKSNSMANLLSIGIHEEIRDYSVVDSETILINFVKENNKNIIFKLKFSGVEEKKKVITIAGYAVSEEMKKVFSQINQSSKDYIIELKDYSNFDRVENGEFFSGADKLNLDMISGEIPDMIIGNDSLDISLYEKLNSLTDLNEMIDKDKSFKKDDYFSIVFDLYNKNNSLYRIFPQYSFTSVVGKKDIVGNSENWSIYDLYNFADKNKTFGFETYHDLAGELILNNLNEYINIDTNKCDFETEDFKNLLKFIKENAIKSETIQEKLEENNNDVKNGQAQWEKWYGEDDYNLLVANINDLNRISDIYKNNFRENDISFLGMPSKSNEGFVISPMFEFCITKKCDEKEYAWDIIKVFLNDYQKEISTNFGLPVKVAEYEKIENSIKNNYEYKNIEIFDEIKHNIKSAKKVAFSNKKIKEIVNEQLELYFNNIQDVETTAKNIQQKMKFYLDENY